MLKGGWMRILIILMILFCFFLKTSDALASDISVIQEVNALKQKITEMSAYYEAKITVLEGRLIQLENKKGLTVFCFVKIDDIFPQLIDKPGQRFM